MNDLDEVNKILQAVRLAIQDAEQEAQNLKPDNTLITAVVRSIARKCFQRVKNLPKDQLLDLCEALLETGDWRERTIAFQWAFRIRKSYEASDFYRFERWLSRYVVGWGSCDNFCTHTFGALIKAYPEHIPAVKSWTASSNRWFRRGAAVVMIYSIRTGQNIPAGFEIADLLLMDPDDLVQKGYGWMLKEISKLKPSQVFDYIQQRKDHMPRTSLRYAIEKLSPDLRAQAMAK
jgi:3-methyladenine DNA glycosylase AlkD